MGTDNDVDATIIAIMCSFKETSQGVDNGSHFITLLKFYSCLTFLAGNKNLFLKLHNQNDF